MLSKMSLTEEDITICQICFEKFNTEGNTPRLLPCSHTLCHLCIESLITPTKHNLECPVCRNNHIIRDDGAKTFPQNKYILQFISLQNKVKAKTFSQDTDLKRCGVHNRELGLFCRECQIEICQKCFIFQHKDHSTVDVEIKCKEDLDSAIDATVKKIEGYEEKISQMFATFDRATENQISQLNNKAEECKKVIQCIFDEYGKLLHIAHDSNVKTIDDHLKMLSKNETLLDDLQPAFHAAAAGQFSTHMEVISDIGKQVDSLVNKGVEVQVVKYFPSDENEQRKCLKDIAHLHFQGGLELCETSEDPEGGEPNNLGKNNWVQV